MATFSVRFPDNKRIEPACIRGKRIEVVYPVCLPEAYFKKEISPSFDGEELTGFAAEVANEQLRKALNY